jgi:hypothetical protein
MPWFPTGRLSQCGQLPSGGLGTRLVYKDMHVHDTRGRLFALLVGLLSSSRFTGP